MSAPVLLLVDDEPEVLKALTRVFRGSPYSVLTAGCAKDAKRIVESAEVDVVISDFRMPDTDGIDLFRWIARLQPRIVRILMSGYAEAERVLAACHEGEVDRFVPKPWDSCALLDCVNGLVEARGTRERKDYLEALLDSSPDNIIIIDLDGRIVPVNDPAKAMVRRVSGGAATVDVASVLRGGEGEYEALKERLLQEGHVGEHETHLLTPSGKLPVTISISTFRDRKGKAKGAVAIVKDISTRRSTERALRRANRKLRRTHGEVRRVADELSHLYGVSSTLASVVDFDRLIEQTASALIGRGLADVAGLALFGGSPRRAFLYVPEVLDEQAREAARHDFVDGVEWVSAGPPGTAAALCVLEVPGRRVAEADTSEIADLVLPLGARGRDLGRLWVRQYGKGPQAHNQEQLLKTIALELAVTIDRLQEVEIEERRRIQALIEGMSEPVIMLDENFRMLCAHPQARLLLGLKEGNTDLDFGRLEPPALARLFQRAARDRDRTLEEEIVLPLSTPRIFRVAITPVTREGGALIGTVAVFQDVTRWREAEQLKSDFVANVSHELRTPLTSIKEATSLLMDGVVGEISDKQRECLQIAAGECERLARLVDDILELSRIESARICLNRTYSSVLSTAKSALESLRRTAENAGISLTIEAPRSIPMLLFDHDRVTQILVNLLGNAIKFTSQGGTVRLVIESGDRFVRIRVIDNGSGIPEGETEKIFEKFYRGDSAVSYAKQGTGLGLPICKALVQLHGGTIGVKSEVGKGTEIHFTLPRITARRALVDHVESVIERARREEQHVGLIALVLGGEGRKKEGDPLFLERVRTIVAKGIYKARDRVFTRDGRSLVIVLPEADGPALGAVVGRLEELLRKELGEEIVARRLAWRRAVYPVDGHKARDLLRVLARPARPEGRGASTFRSRGR